MTIDVVEPSPRFVDAATLALAGVDLLTLRAALKPLVRIDPADDGYALVPRTNVGTIAVGGLRVNVRPRLGDADLVALIRYAYGDDADAIARSRVVAAEGEGIDELIGRALAEELAMIRQRGVARRYVDRLERLSAVRGRVDFLASFPLSDRGNATLACRYHELSCDNLDNRLIVAGLETAGELALRPATRAALAAHRHAWRSLAPAPARAGPAELEAARSRYTRLNAFYRLAHHLCELIVTRRRPRSPFDETPIATAGLALDMARLFELAVARLLGDALRSRGIEVREQHVDADAILDGEGCVYRRVRPDVLLMRERVPVAVVDAKYKDLWPATGGRPDRKIGNDDLYQLFFYAARQQLAHSLTSPPPAVIVAPAPGDDRSAIDAKYRRVMLRAGAGGTHRLALVLLPLAAIVREGGRGAMSATFVDELMEAIEGVAA